MKSRRLKKIVSIVATICICFLSVCSFSVRSFAAANYYLDYPEPSTSTSQGYMVATVDNNGSSEIVTFVWNFTVEDTDTGNYLDVPLNLFVASGSVQFTLNIPEAYWCTGYIGIYNVYGNFKILKTFNIEEGPVSYLYSMSSLPITAFYVRGGVGSITHSVTDGLLDPASVIFNNEVSGRDLLNKLDSIITNTGNTYAILTACRDYLKTMSLNIIDIEEALGLANSYLKTMSLNVIDIETFLSDKIFPELQNISKLLGTQSAEEEEETDAYKETSANQSSSLDQATQDSQTEKVDAASASGSVDDVLGSTDISVGTNQIFVIFTDNSLVVTLLLLVFVVALISYVLFGKR